MVILFFNIVNIQFSLFENILIDRQFSENTSITRKCVMHTRRDMKKKARTGQTNYQPLGNRLFILGQRAQRNTYEHSFWIWRSTITCRHV